MLIHSAYPLLFRDGGRDGRLMPLIALVAMQFEHRAISPAACRQHVQTAGARAVHRVEELDADGTSISEYRSVQTVTKADNVCSIT